MPANAACFLAIVALTPVATTQAPALRVLCLDASRSSPCGMDTFSFPISPQLASARSELVSAANFGAGGIVQRSIQLVPAGVIDPTTLANIHVVLLNPLRDGLSDCELASLADFVQQGGGLFAFDNRMSEETRAVTGCGPIVNCGTFTYASLGSHAILTGPFGAISGSMPTVYNCQVTSIVPNGTAFLGSGAGLVGIAYSLGLGRAVVIDEEEFLMNTGGCPASPSWSLNNPRRVLLNSMWWVAPAAAFQYVPGAHFCTFGAGCAGSGGTPALQAIGTPALGSTFTVNVTNLPPAGGAAFMAVGFSDAMWNGQALPLALAGFGMVGCTAYVSVELTTLLLHTNGTAQWQVQIPSSPSLAGTRFFEQALSIDPAASTQLGAVVSNAGRAVIG